MIISNHKIFHKGFSYMVKKNMRIKIIEALNFTKKWISLTLNLTLNMSRVKFVGIQMRFVNI